MIRAWMRKRELYLIYRALISGVPGAAVKGGRVEGSRPSCPRTPGTPLFLSVVIYLAEIDGGFIILARKVFDEDHWVWQLKPTHFKFLIGVLFMARWKPEPGDYTAPDGTVIEIERGQYACPTRRLSKELKLTHQIVRTCLVKFSELDFLTHDVTHGVTVITIRKYDRYQDIKRYSNTTDNPPITHEQHTPPEKVTQEQHKGNTLKNKGNKGNKGIKEKGNDINAEKVLTDFNELGPGPKHERLSDKGRELIISLCTEGDASGEVWDNDKFATAFGVYNKLLESGVWTYKWPSITDLLSRTFYQKTGPGLLRFLPREGYDPEKEVGFDDGKAKEKTEKEKQIERLESIGERG